ncbi:3-isopropylmalate dehydratase small subunit [Novosphingobium piscinae]|uniref:3-isopropylmalate dehydratase n=1 Tax=Novosphingobium piscinae TaxID=1507448 RepID=A0A7X1G0T2_9SPHN|nr:3-isopropylmalate dehydratase small subunit [Novosphingobium piscinae]MBC2669872.1 3-isopropylmalate dehydratase small subunit [Novosphingobium piscinae]
MPAEPFTTVHGRAAALREDNIDTDIIFPARFLLITAREGLGRYAFHDRRFAGDGQAIAGFVYNDPRFRAAPVLVAGANFGSGSSREQAVWALHGLGVRAVIAPGFGEIFHGNCLRNGIVPILLGREVVTALMDRAEAGLAFTVDLAAQTLTVTGEDPIPFAIPRERRLALLNGWDETDQVINTHGADIAAFEAWQRRTQPWLHV